MPTPIIQLTKREFIGPILDRLRTTARNHDIEDSVKAIEGIVALCRGFDLKFEDEVQQHVTFGVTEDKTRPGVWIVGAVDDDSEGKMYMASFSGFNARARAVEYAEWKTGWTKPCEGGVSVQPDT